METYQKIIPVALESDEWEIWAIGDIHAGARGCYEDAVKAVVKRIADNPNALWIGVGDFVDAIVIQDNKRFDPTGLAHWIPIDKLYDAPQLEEEWIVDNLGPIKDKCIGLHDGNHETELMKRHNRNITASIASKFNCPYLCYSSWGYLKFRHKAKSSTHARRLSMYTHHGYGGGRYIGGKSKKLAEMGLRFHADITVGGHHHDPFLRPTGKPTLQDRSKGKPTFKVRSRIEIACSSFYKTYVQGTTTYGEKQGYDFTWIGGTYGTVKPFVRKGEGSDDRGYKLGLHAVDV